MPNLLQNAILKSDLPLAETLPTTIKCTEIVSKACLWQILVSDVPNKDALYSYLAKAKQLDQDRYQVVHEFRRSENSPKHGRYYSGGSLITMKKSYRAFIMDNQYCELDIRASNPALLVYLMRQHGKMMPCLSTYLDNREVVHQEMESLIPAYAWDAIDEPVTPKLIINGTLNGSEKYWNWASPFLGVRPYYKDLKTELNEAMDYVYSFYREVAYRSDSRRPKASCLTNVLLTLESYIIFSVMEMISSKYKESQDPFRISYAYDGILVPLDGDYDLDDIQDWANEMMANWGLWETEFVCKPCEPVEIDGLIQVTTLPMYVPDLNALTENKKILIRYPTGCGKTFQAIRYAKDKFTRILFIAHRRTLVSDIKQNYPFFDSYLPSENGDPTYDGDCQIICLNSLNRLKNPGKYECIIADEVSSLLKQLVGMKMGKSIGEMIRVYIGSDKFHFIGMDALLCDDDVDYLNSLTKFDVLCPSVLRYPRKFAKIYSDFNIAKATIMKQVIERKRICIAYSVKIASIDGFLTGLGVEYINVNRYTKRDHTISDWQQYQIVAFSPTMDAGVDVSFYDDLENRVQHFDCVWGLFNIGNTDPKVAVQMLGRVRDCVDYRIAYQGSHTDTIFEHYGEFKAYLSSRLALIDQFELDYYLDDTFQVSLFENYRFWLTWHVLSKSTESRNSSYGYYLRKYLLMNNWFFEDYIEEATETDLVNDFKKFELNGSMQQARCIASARIIDSETAMSIAQHHDMDEESFYRYESYNVMRAFALDRLLEEHPNSESVDVNCEYLDRVHQQKYDMLYSYNEAGEQIQFDYIAAYVRNRAQYFRTKQLIDLENGRELTIHFAMKRASFSEITHLVYKIIGSLGFYRLNADIQQIDLDGVHRNRHLGRLLRNRSVHKFLEETSALRIIRSQTGGYRLASTCISPFPDNIDAMYIEGSPFAYISPVGPNFEIWGNKVKCKTCFRIVSRKWAAKHKCKELPEGFRYAEIDGQSVVLCNVCEMPIARNRNRHMQSHIE